MGTELKSADSEESRLKIENIWILMTKNKTE